MTEKEFKTEYEALSRKAVQASEKARREGLLAIEDSLNHKKINKRDVFEYGMRLVVDGTDGEIIKTVLSNLVSQETDPLKKKLGHIAIEAVLSIQAGDHPCIIAVKSNSRTPFSLDEDGVLDKAMAEEGAVALSKDEMDSLLAGVDAADGKE